MLALCSGLEICCWENRFEAQHDVTHMLYVFLTDTCNCFGTVGLHALLIFVGVCIWQDSDVQQKIQAMSFSLTTPCSSLRHTQRDLLKLKLPDRFFLYAILGPTVMCNGMMQF